jgi:hypothetical protein
MNWFDKWIAKKVRRAWESTQEEKHSYTLNSIGIKTAELVSRDRMDSNPDLNFRMFRAENGYVMEVRYNDKRTDRSTSHLHLISDDQDLGQSIAHIITVESLKVN